MWSNNDRNGLTFPPGATSGARMVIGFDPDQNDYGIFAYNSIDKLVFSLSSTTGNFKAFGDLSGSTLTIPAGAIAGTPRIVIDSTGINIYGPGAKIAKIDINVVLPFGGISPMRSNTFRSLNDLGVSLQANDPLGGGNYQTWTFGSGNITAVDSGSPQGGPGSMDLYKFGNGLQGSYYYEEWTLSAQNIGSNVVVQLVNFGVAQQFSDYISPMNLATGVWTCPQSGVYTFTLAYASLAFVAGSRMFVRVLSSGSGAIKGEIDLSPQPGYTLLNFTRYVQATDTLIFQVLQSTGAIKTIDIAQSYLAIRRNL